MQTPRKICVVTGTRAEYGLLRWVMQLIKEDPELMLQIVVTGMHLSPEFGLTYQEIERDEFHIDRKVEMLTSSDTSVGIAKSIGLGLIGFSDVLNELKPDLVLMLGDRFEVFSAAVAALIAGIPIAHLHGGERTEGAFDEALRHSITKMAQLHFTATETYKNRVIQLGEHPDTVFNVGGLGVDSIEKIDLLNREAVESKLDFKFKEKNVLVTFHPVTLESNTAEEQMLHLLTALSELQDTQIIFTLPNADTNSRILIEMVNEFVTKHQQACVFVSLGQLLYFSCLAQVDVVIGNSSSGLLEAPSFKKPTVNIGDRQKGRLQSESIVNCSADAKRILDAISVAYSEKMQSKLCDVENPYGNGGASEKVIGIIKNYSLKGIAKKVFYDLPAYTLGAGT